MGFKRFKKKLMNIEFRHLRHLKNRCLCGFPPAEKHGKPSEKMETHSESSPQTSPTKYQVGIEFGNPIGMKIDD